MNEDAKKILIIEDDSHISKVYRLQLEENGFSTIIAQDGKEAILILEKETPDLIILDLMLPKKDGFFILENIRKNNKFIKTPVIIISNIEKKLAEEQSLKLGATEYLVKLDNPIQDVINKIKLYLE